MSDLASPTASGLAKQALAPSGHSPNSLAFLVHSQDTVQHNLPPDVDNKSLARQKRKRTSPEDSKVLEAEYQRNPKPDKAARMEIVSRVALGEKEVQIWFQNRRQNSRRKSRPLLTHEILPHLRSNFATPDMGPTLQSSSVSIENQPDDEEAEESVVPEHEQPLPAPIASVSAVITSGVGPSQPETSEITDATSLPATQDPPNADSQTTVDTSQEQLADSQAYDTALTEPSSSQVMPSSQGPIQPLLPKMGYLANRRSASFVVTSDDEPLLPAAAEAPSGGNEQSSYSFQRSHSYLRLSTTSDGKARIIGLDDQSPSPPRSQPIPSVSTFAEQRGPLRRNHSATSLHDKLKQTQGQSTAKKLGRLSSGRSRDSRTWEFWCDRDAQNSLAGIADQERSGSAADAIGLIRSNSSRVLRPNQNKRNAQVQMQNPSAKRSKVDSVGQAKAQLMRGSSSAGRLQTKVMATEKSPVKGKASEEFEVLVTESDKENWEPSEPDQSPRRRRLPQSQPDRAGGRRVLGENTQVLSQNASLGAMMAREKQQKSPRKRPAPDAENVNPEDDEEIAMFMGGSRATSGRTSVSSGEDLDCVQGLLKLSQGNWR